MATSQFEDLFGTLRADLARLGQEIDEKQQEYRELEAALRVLESRVDTAENRFKGLTLMQAAKRCLEDAGKPLSTAEIRQAMEVGGWSSTSKHPYAIVYQALSHHAKSPDKSGVRKAGKKWALVKKGENA